MPTISPKIFGGMIWDASSYTVHAAALLVQAHWHPNAKPFAIMGTQDGADGWRWDDNTIIPGGNWAPNASSLNPVHTVDSPNTAVIDKWDSAFATDYSRYLKVKKTATGNRVYAEVFNNSSGEALPVYIRFDVAIDSATTFVVTDPWVLMRVRNTGFSDIVRLELTNAKEIDMVIGASKVTSPVLATDTKYSVEVKITSTELELWVQPTGDTPVSRGTISVSNGSVKDVRLGADGAVDCEGRIFIDRFRMDAAFMGTTLPEPWDHSYIAVHTWDGERKTIDELAQIFVTVGGELYWRTKMHNTSTAIDVDQQFWEDFVEYVLGTSAGPDDSQDFTHTTPGDNWADLRNFRGRVAPYPFKTFIIGAEPYFLGDYARNATGATDYANDFNAFATGMKGVDPTIITLCHADDGATGVDNWEDTVLPIIKNNVDGQDCYHMYSKRSVSTNEQVPWLHGYPNSTGAVSNSPPEKNGEDGRMYHARFARAKFDEHLVGLSHLPAARDRIGLSEWGFATSVGIGDGNYLGYALMRSSLVIRAIKDDYGFLSAWLLVSEADRTEGMISVKKDHTVELTPSFYAYKILSKLAGMTRADVTDTNTHKTVQTDFLSDRYSIPAISAVGGRSGATVRIAVVNALRSTIRTTISLSGFTPQTTATLFKVGGRGFNPFADNADNPNNVIDTSSPITVAATFIHAFEPYSINVIEMTEL